MRGGAGEGADGGLTSGRWSSSSSPHDDGAPGAQQGLLLLRRTGTATPRARGRGWHRDEPAHHGDGGRLHTGTAEGLTAAGARREGELNREGKNGEWSRERARARSNCQANLPKAHIPRMRFG